MKLKPSICVTALIVLLTGAMSRADQIILKDGTVYSGKFIRGDSKLIDFNILERVEKFKTTDVSKIIFEEPPRMETRNTADTSAQKADQGSLKNEGSLSPITEKPVLKRPLPEPGGMDAQGATITVSKGMSMIVRTTTEIDTDRNRVGDSFEAILDENLVSGTQIVAARGSLIKGRIAYAKESGKLAGQAQLVLELTELLVNGKAYSIRTSDYTELGASRGTRTAATVGGTAALGAIIGAIAGGGKGAAIGAASGAAVGTGVQVMTKGQVLRIPAETVLEFRLESPLTVDVP